MSEHEWSSPRLAALAGVSDVTLHRWDETGALTPSVVPGGRGRYRRRVWSDDDACWAVVLGEDSPDRRSKGTMTSTVLRAPALWRPRPFPYLGWLHLVLGDVWWALVPEVQGPGLVWLVDCARTWATVRAGHRDDTHARELST